MAGKSLSKAGKQHTDDDKPITKEERTLLQMYRRLARWDRNCIFMVIDSLSSGVKTPETDKYSWDQISAGLGLSEARKAVLHG